MTDPFDILAGPDERVAPRHQFRSELRARLARLLDVPPAIDATRRQPMSSTTSTTSPAADETSTARAVTPYLAVHDGPAALDFYAIALGATEVVRVTMDDGRIGHAEFTIGSARFFLADEFPDIGVHSPRSLGGSGVTLHLDVRDVDAAYGAAVAAGADAVAEPADQPHGARHGTLVDPFGHRWMLSQQIEDVTLRAYGDRLSEQGATVTSPAPEAASTSGSTSGGIWAALNYADASAGIRFMVDVLGFEEVLVVPGDEPGVVVHSQLRWPEGGIVLVGTANRPGNVFSERPAGAESLYVITSDPRRVHERCVQAGAEVVVPPTEPDYDPGGLVFAIRDHEGNLWSFGTYAGES